MKASALLHDRRSALNALAIENDVRKDISPFERAFFVHRAAATEAFSKVDDVITHMYQHASASKISKIKSLVKLVDFFGDLVVHKNCIQEATGLRLVKYLEAGATDLKLQRMLREVPIDCTSEEELGLLNTYLKEAKPLYERQTATPHRGRGHPKTKRLGARYIATDRAVYFEGGTSRGVRLISDEEGASRFVTEDGKEPLQKELVDKLLVDITEAINQANKACG